MSRERLRIVALALAGIAMLLVAALVLRWFRINIPSMGSIEVGLHDVKACERGQCATASIRMQGAFGTFASIAFWGALVQSVFLAYQTYVRLSVGVIPEGAVRAGTAMGIGLVILGVLTGFILAPSLGNFGAITSTRSWAPLLYLGGAVLGIVAIQLSSREDAPAPRVEPPVAVRPPSVKQVALGPEAALDFVMLGGEITAAGIDARRASGGTLLVMWRDVVGFVVRRAPDELGGVTFADLVSTQGSTLRVVPASRLTGVVPAGEGDARVRALATYMQSVCPALAIDGATRKFLAGEPPAQLRDAAMLAAHDERLR